MMRLKPFSKNLAKLALLSSVIPAIFLLSACSSSTAPTYQKKDIPKAIREICKKDYNISVRSRIVGSTLWVYLPINGTVEIPKKKEKYTERFEIKSLNSDFKDSAFNIDYHINAVPEAEKPIEYKYTKDAIEKRSKVWAVIRRVLFSMDRKNFAEPKFICFITADIKYGFITKDLGFYLDLKKVSYELISMTEYQHRVVTENADMPQVKDDTQGTSIAYKDFTMEEFIAAQIKSRIRLKFQKPEVEKKADMDKEILKVTTTTLKIYDYKDFREVSLSNLRTGEKTILNEAAIWTRDSN